MYHLARGTPVHDVTARLFCLQRIHSKKQRQRSKQAGVRAAKTDNCSVDFLSKRTIADILPGLYETSCPWQVGHCMAAPLLLARSPGVGAGLIQLPHPPCDIVRKPETETCAAWAAPNSSTKDLGAVASATLCCSKRRRGCRIARIATRSELKEVSLWEARSF